MLKRLIFGLIVFVGFNLITAVNSQVAAQSEFKVVIDREYNVEADGTLQVIETHTVRNESQNRRVISKSNEESFQISVVSGSKDKLEETVRTAVLTIDGQQTNFDASYHEDKAIISVFYPREITKNQQIVFRLQYTNYGLVERVGALYDIYAPGFAKDIQFVSGLTETEYNTLVRVSSSLPEENFAIPSPTKTEDANGFRVYTFGQETLVGKTIWIQRGKVQYYQFKIVQQGSPTDEKDTGYQNEYHLILPRDIDEGEVYQKVYFAKISPEPSEIIRDSDENLLGVFKFSSHLAFTVTIEGYAAVGLSDFGVNATNGGLLNQLSSDLVSTYTKAAQFWEVDSSEIQKVAKDLKGSSQNIFDIISKTYEFVVNSIDYSEVKRFGLNERQGALTTLKQGAGVCMEYSDLFLTLVRAQGIPARAVFGYGYDSKLDSNAQEAHQWVNVYLPGVEKWVSVDVTWGESGDALIGGDLNHFYTHVATTDPNTPPMVERVSYGNDVPLKAPEFEISAVAGLVDEQDLTTQAQILSKYPVREEKSQGFNLTDFINDLRSKIFTILNNEQDKQKFSVIFIVCGSLLVLLSLGILVYMIVGSKRQQMDKKGQRKNSNHPLANKKKE